MSNLICVLLSVAMFAKYCYPVFNYILYRLYIGCQWDALPIAADSQHPEQREISPDAVAYHFHKWCRDGSLKQVGHNSITTIRELLDVAELNLDGSLTIAKKGGDTAAYQGRKKAKTSNILPLTDKKGFIIASTTIIAGNHNDAFELKENLSQLFKDLKQQQITIKGAYFNVDSAFDTKAARKVCFNYGVVPNIPENRHNRELLKRGRKRLFNPVVYKHRFSAERTFVQGASGEIRAQGFLFLRSEQPGIRADQFSGVGQLKSFG